MISTATQAAMLAVSFITILGPIAVLIIWSRKKKLSPIPALTGAVIFYVFVRVLEQIPHMFFVLTKNPVSDIITSTPLLFALYGGLAAGIFEETGRFVAFRFFLKNYPKKGNAITYGVGHGGFEAISIVGFGFLQYFSVSQIINNGSAETMMAAASGDTLASMQAAVTAVSSVTIASCILSIVERLYVFVFHIALSVLVFEAVRTPGKKWLFPVAILLHAFLNFFAGLCQTDVLPLIATEIIGIIITAGVALFARKIYKEHTEDEEYEA